MAGSAAFLAEAAFIAAVPFLPGTVTVAVAVALVGACNGYGNVVTVTAFQQWAPDGMLGRLMGLLLITSFGVYPVSVALAGLAGRGFGTSSFFLCAAAVLAAAILGGLTQRSWRDFAAARRPSPPGEPRRGRRTSRRQQAEAARQLAGHHRHRTPAAGGATLARVMEPAPLRAVTSSRGARVPA